MSISNLFVPNNYQIYENQCIPYTFSGTNLNFLAPVNTIYNFGIVPQGKKFICNSITIYCPVSSSDVSDGGPYITIGSSSYSYNQFLYGSSTFQIPNNLLPIDTFIVPISTNFSTFQIQSAPSNDLIGIQINTASTGTEMTGNVYIIGFLV